MASFQAKIGWKRPRKRKNKNYHSVPKRRVIENSKKIAKKFKKYRYVFYSSQNRFEKDEKMKTIVPFHSYSTRN